MRRGLSPIAALAVVLVLAAACMRNDGPARAAPQHGYRLAFTEDGQLAPASRAVADEVVTAAAGATDVFIFSHGWWNSPATAECRYSQMIDGISAMARAQRPQDFRSVLVGIYWPSAVFPPTKGDCDEATSGEVPESTGPLAFQQRLREWAPAAFPTAAARPAFGPELDRVVELLSRERDGQRLSKTEADDLVQIFVRWRDAAGDRTTAIDPGEGLFEGDAQTVAERWQRPEATTSGEATGAGGARRWVEWANVFTFWVMKDRAGLIGGRGVHDVVRRLQAHRPRGVRIHLIGHSFGGKLVTAAIAGDRGGAATNTVDSLVLLQAAFSHFALSTTDQIKSLGVETQRPGLYASVLSDRRVDGPVVVTYSTRDSANQFWYPRGVAVTNDFLERAAVNKFGALGADGLQGPPVGTIVLGRDSFADRVGRAGVWHFNADGSTVVLGHSDFAKREVFQLIWDAALAARQWRRPAP